MYEFTHYSLSLTHIPYFLDFSRPGTTAEILAETATLIAVICVCVFISYGDKDRFIVTFHAMV